MCLKQREPCVGAEKPEKFYDKIDGFNNTSKSLENLSRNLDSTDDNSEECMSLDTLSLNDKKSASEKRLDYLNKQMVLNQNNEYYSFGATISESLSSSRSQSPDSNNNIKDEESRIILGESNENLTNDCNEKSQNNLSATNIIASNPKINKSSSLYFTNLNTKIEESKNRLPAAPVSKTSSTNKVKQETPLLTNLLLYSSAMAKVTSLKNNENQRTNKL